MEGMTEIVLEVKQSTKNESPISNLATCFSQETGGRERADSEAEGVGLVPTVIKPPPNTLLRLLLAAPLLAFLSFV